MTALIGGYVVAGLVLLMSAYPMRRLEKRVAEGAELDHQDLRAFAEARGQEIFPFALGFLAVVSAVFQILRDRPLGWAWFGMAAMYGLAVVLGRRRRHRVLEALGDRGQVERSSSYERRSRWSSWFGVVTIVGWVGGHVVDHVYAAPLPDGAVAVKGLFAAVMVVGFGGVVVVRTRMYVKGDDLPGTAKRD